MIISRGEIFSPAGIETYSSSIVQKRSVSIVRKIAQFRGGNVSDQLSVGDKYLSVRSLECDHVQEKREKIESLVHLMSWVDFYVIYI